MDCSTTLVVLQSTVVLHSVLRNEARQEKIHEFFCVCNFFSFSPVTPSRSPLSLSFSLSHPCLSTYFFLSCSCLFLSFSLPSLSLYLSFFLPLLSLFPSFSPIPVSLSYSHSCLPFYLCLTPVSLSLSLPPRLSSYLSLSHHASLFLWFSLSLSRSCLSFSLSFSHSYLSFYLSLSVTPSVFLFYTCFFLSLSIFFVFIFFIFFLFYLFFIFFSFLFLPIEISLSYPCLSLPPPLSFYLSRTPVSLPISISISLSLFFLSRQSLSPSKERAHKIML